MSEMHNEDLFEDTKMSFGEHLEELRVCLVKALIGLAIGFAIGLSVAGWVVKRIEGPLQEALVKFHEEKTESELKQQFDDVPQELIDFVQNNQLVFEDVYWEADEFKRLLAGMLDEADDVNNSLTTLVPSLPVVKTRLWRPLDANVTSLSAHEPFMIWIKAALITGAVVASPWIFFQIWTFVAAGLYPQEKQYVYFFMPFSLGLFFAGAALAFFFVFEPVLDFLFKFNRMMNIDPDPRISEWISFVLMLPLGFGISFQLPLAMLILERVGIVTIGAYIDKWRIAVLVICVISMLLTPADPISMLLMAVPLTMLYFGGILLCRYLPKRSSPYGEGYDPQ